MNKEINRYTFALSLMGIINVSLIVLSLNAIVVLSFPEYEGILHLWNVYGVLIPLIPLAIAAEKKGENKWWKLILILLTILSIMPAKGNVAKTGWAFSLIVFMIPALFAPRPGGKLLMERPRIWHVIVFLVSYGIGQINENFHLSSLSVVLIYVFFVIWVLSININRFLKRIRDEKGEVDVVSILKENRRQIIVFVALFTLLSLLLPFVIENLQSEKKTTSIEYEWGEDGEEQSDDSLYQPIPKEKGLSRDSKPFNLSLLGNILMWTFVAAVLGFLLLESFVLIMKIREIDGRRQTHRDQFKEDFSVEAIVDFEKKKKGKVKLFLSVDEKIRRKYKKSVVKRSGEAKLEALSTREIQDEILSFDSYEFSSIYEDARYSQKKVENRDYERMKGILDKQKKSSK